MIIHAIHRLIYVSIKRKIVLTNFVVSGLITVITLLMVINGQIDSLRATLVARSEVYGKLVATTSLQWVLTGDTIALSEVIEATKQIPEIIYVAVIDKNGKVLGHTDRQYIGKYMTDEKTLMLINKVPEPAQIVLYESALAVESAVAQKENGRVIGFVRVRLSGQATLDSILDYVYRVVLFGLFIMLMGLVVAFVLAQKITKGIHELIVAIARYKTGEEMPEMPHTRLDEIGLLARTIRQFMAELNVKKKRIKSYQEELEQKIKERTSDLEIKTQELEHINSFFVDREIRMAELKEENMMLKHKLDEFKSNTVPKDY